MRRGFLAFLLCSAFVFLAAQSKTTLRGRLSQNAGKKPILELPDHKLVALEGDNETTGVVNDKRLRGADLEVTGRFVSGRFVIDPFTSRDAMYLHKDGKKYTISYWCPVCSIRTYTPGKCMCCQQETHLDLQEAAP